MEFTSGSRGLRRAAPRPPRRFGSYESETPHRQQRRTTNRHEARWTCLAATTSRDEGRERGRPARTTLARLHPSPPPGSTGNGATIPLQPSPGRSRRQGGRVPHHGETERPPNIENAGETPALPAGLLPSFWLREKAQPLPMRQSRPASCIFSETPNRQLGRTTNEHEYRWTCIAATTSREEGRERGRPARTTVAQRHPSPRPGSTGKGATIPLQPSPWGSHRQGARAPHHGESERPPNAEDAGETPALPEGRLLPSFLLREKVLPLPMRQSRPASCIFSETPNRQLGRTTNEHEDQWTCLAATPSREEGRERGRPARTTLARLHPSPPPGSTGNGATIPLQPSPGRSRRQGGRAPHHGETERPPNAEDAGETPALPEGRLLPSFLLREEAQPLPMRQSRPASCIFSETPNRQLGRTTNEHEYRWTCIAATTSREEGRERGRPARTTVAQRHPSPRPGSTGNGARIPLQPSPGRSRRQGGRVPHHGKAERPPNAENAGETPALPEGRLLPSFLLGEEALPLPMRQCRSASCLFSETPNRQLRRTTNRHE